MQRKILWSTSLTVIAVVILILPFTPVYTVEQVKWKTFKEKNGLFTINYLSNWSPVGHPQNPTHQLISISFIL